MTVLSLGDVHPAVAGAAAQMLEALNAGFPRVHEMTAAAARAVLAERVQPVDNLDDADSEDLEIEGPGGRMRVRVYRPRPPSATGRPGILFSHGGGWVFCSIESHDGFCRWLARAADAVVVSVDYRLAPEHPAPAAAEDCFAALRWLAEHAAELGVDADRLLVAGDSSGGNLATVTALMARDAGGPALAGQVLAYPVIEPDFETESYREFGTGNFNTLAAMQWYWRHYVGGLDLPADPPYPPAWVAPLRAESLVGLPPAIVVTAGRDPLCTEDLRYVAALRAAGVEVRHRHYPDLFHGFLTIGPFAPAASARDLLVTDLLERTSA